MTTEYQRGIVVTLGPRLPNHHLTSPTPLVCPKRTLTSLVYRSHTEIWPPLHVRSPNGLRTAPLYLLGDFPLPPWHYWLTGNSAESWVPTFLYPTRIPTLRAPPNG